MPFSEDDLELALERFTSSTPENVKRGFEKLSEYAGEYLPGRLGQFLTAGGVEEVIQDVRLRLWNSQPKYKNKGGSAFRGFLRITAVHSMLDWRDQNPAPPDPTKGPEPEDPEAFNLLRRICEDGDAPLVRLLDLADHIWLARDLKESAEARMQRIMFAMYVLVHGMRWEDAWRISVGNRTFDRDVAAAWLSAKDVLLGLAYQMLFMDGDTIVKYLLELPTEMSGDELTQVYNAVRARPSYEVSHAGYTCAEVRVIFWRFRYGDITVRAVTSSENSLTIAEANALVDKCNARLPFLPYMELLTSSFGTDHAKLLQEDGLWKRLAFQYGEVLELPCLDNFARLQAAAECAGYDIDPDKINMWISGKRLLRELLKRLRAMGGGDE